MEQCEICHNRGWIVINRIVDGEKYQVAAKCSCKSSLKVFPKEMGSMTKYNLILKNREWWDTHKYTYEELYSKKGE